MRSSLLPLSFASVVALSWSSPASAAALSCDDIMSMVDVNVPTNIVVQTIDASGESFSAEDIRCLETRGAPAEVITAAKAQARASGTVTRPDDEAPPPDDEKSDFEKESGIGDKRPTPTSRELADRTGGDEGGDGAVDNTADPDELDDAIKAYEAKKPLTSTLKLYEMRKDDKYPEKRSKIEYYLGRGLFDLGMYHSAQYYFIEVLKKGPSDPNFKYALPKLVTIAKYTGDDSDLTRIVAKVPAEEFPRSARNQLYYLLGTRMYEQGRLSEARRYFDQVSDKSDLYTRSKYYQGVIYTRQEKLKSAVAAFTDVAKTQAEAQTQQELDELNRLRDLSLMNIARIYYQLERFDDAKKWYDTVPHESTYWPQTLFESAWTNYMLSDLNLTLGQVLTINSPYFMDQEFLPDARILRALTFFYLCDYKGIERELSEFDATYKPMHDEMKDFLKQYSTEEGKKLADQAYDRYFGDRPAPTALPKSFFLRLLRNKEFGGIVTHLEVMDKEEQLIDAQKSQWKDVVGEGLHKVVAEDRERLKRRAGLVMLQEMAEVTSHMGDLLTQSQIIRFEVVDAKRADYAYKLVSTDLQDTSKEYQRDFAVSKDRIFWPFNGEFWQDELGYYWYTEQAKCK